ncbi:MAG: HAD-IB family hydrolase [Microthrixaceae bacterium]|nr:HAD-IB family hydrolase [Microthrixaceae bacterium]
MLVDDVREWFTANPLYDDKGQPIIVPDWKFPGRGRVESQLSRANTVMKAAEKVVLNLPLRGRAAQWGAALEDRRSQIDRARSYVELYGAYTECEAVYGVNNLQAIRSELDENEQTLFQTDARVVDWSNYITKVHLPSVVAHGRAKTSPGKSTSEKRPDRLRRAVLSPDRHLAAFDLENTLIASNVVTSYMWMSTRRMGTRDRLERAGRILAEAPTLLAEDKRDRSDFLRSFYRRYEGAPVEQLRADAAEHFSQMLMTRSFPAAIRRVREHRQLGHRTVLITGALDFLVEPLEPLFDDIICARLGTEVDDYGVLVYTGQLEDVPPTVEARADLLAQFCRDEGLSLDESVAYADSSSDLPLLEAVGFPVAVNPEPRLASIARRRGWLVEDFGLAPGFRHPVLPMDNRRKR